MKQHALALFHTDWVTMPQHAAVNRERAVANFESVRHSFRKRSFHRGLACFFQRLHAGRGGKKIHIHVSAAAERRLKFLQHQKDFAVEISWRGFWLNVNRPYLSAVLPGGKVCARAVVCVIKANPGRAWSERDSPHSVRGNEGRALFGSSIDISGNRLSVPVELLRRVRVVKDVHDDRHTFLESQKWAGELSIVSSRGND